MDVKLELKKKPPLVGKPENIEAVDLMMALPDTSSRDEWYEFIKPLLMDEESRTQYQMPAQHLFRDVPSLKGVSDEAYIDFIIAAMDKHNICKALVGFAEDSPSFKIARDRFSDRFFFSYNADPHQGMAEVRRLRSLHAEHNIKAVTAFPAGLNPPLPINDKKWYPLYATCIDLDIPFCCCVGVPGPRIPLLAQKVEMIDEVCWFFPELRFVMRHGAMPWTALAVSLMLKYPNLYYSTSAMAPKYYPKDIIDYANSRGSDKIMFAGYFPIGLTLDRIFDELKQLPLRENVWPKFLHENAQRVFKI